MDEQQKEAHSVILSLHLFVQFAFGSAFRKSLYTNKPQIAESAAGW